jgi:hypothetical protein
MYTFNIVANCLEHRRWEIPCRSAGQEIPHHSWNVKCKLRVYKGLTLDRVLKPINMVEASWNVMAHAQKPDFVFRRNGRVHLNRRGHQFSRLLAAEVCASAGWIHHVPRKCEEYWLPTTFDSFPFTSPPVRHRVPSHFNWSLHAVTLRTFCVGGPAVDVDFCAEFPSCYTTKNKSIACFCRSQ